MKIPLNKLRPNMGWYTSTARVPAPKIWRSRKKAAPHHVAPPLVSRRRLRALRVRGRRRAARRRPGLGSLAGWIVLAIGAVVLLRLIFGVLELDMGIVGDRLAELIRGSGH